MNKIKIFWAYFSLTIIFLNNSLAQVPENIMKGFKAGNAREISNSFASNINLKILDKEEIYSKAQAELILKDFFSKNPPVKFSEIHTGNPRNGARYSICKLETSSKVFRTYIYLKKGEDQKDYIQELKIEPDQQ